MDSKMGQPMILVMDPRNPKYKKLIDPSSMVVKEGGGNQIAWLICRVIGTTTFVLAAYESKERAQQVLDEIKAATENYTLPWEGRI